MATGKLTARYVLLELGFSEKIDVLISSFPILSMMFSSGFTSGGGIQTIPGNGGSSTASVGMGHLR